MRSIILTVVVLGALIGGFAVYLSMQTETQKPVAGGDRSGKPNQPDKSAVQTTQSSGATTQRAGESVLGVGEDVWFQSFDRETGLLTSEFRAARYDPPQDGVVHVIRPEARFYTHSGQVMTLTARDGNVVMAEQTKKSDRMDSIQSAPPARGTLNDVTLSVLDDPDAAAPTLTCRLPVVSFDNDALRLSTEQTEIDGRIVPGDRVPITVRGEEYDFDGEGLLMRWNQRDQRLEKLEIAHGKRLVVKKPSAFGKMPLASAGLRERMKSALPIQLVNADEAEAKKMSAEEMERRRQKRLAAARRAAALAATQKVVEPVAYRATFADNVKIFEGESEIGSADQMLATFTFDEDRANKADESIPAESTTQPTTKPASHHVAVTHPTTSQPATTQPTAPQSATQPAMRPADKETAQAPIEIRWTGKLTVIPTKYAESGLRSFEDRTVQLEGSPVKLIREGNQIEAATVSAASVGNRFSARGNEKLGAAVLTDSTGTTLRAGNIDVVGALATITGPSTAEMVVTGDGQQKQKILTSWNEKAVVRFTTDEHGQRVMDQATFTGGVGVKHPEIELQSDELALAFAPAGAEKKHTLKTVDATGHVKAKLISSENAQQITSDLLHVEATTQADGQLAFNAFKAVGHVAIADARQSLFAREVEARFTNAGEGKKEIIIEQLVAQGDVQFKGSDEVAATADVLTIQTKDGIEKIRLQGKEASVSDAQSRLIGSVINIASDGSQASVVGAGRMMGKMSGDGKADAVPVSVSWADSFDYDGVKNVMTVLGGVRIESTGSDGSKQSATGKKMIVAMAEDAKVKDGGAEKTISGKQAMGRKSVDSITLSDEVEVSSHLFAANDADQLLRRVHLFAPAVTVKMEKDGTAGPIVIPTGGRMLFEDRRGADAGGAIQGAVAIEWGKSMAYDPKQNQVVLEGDVVVVHREPDKKPVQMQTQKLVAELNPQSGSNQQTLKSVRAENGASFTSEQVRFDAASATYDPGADRIIAKGSDRRPVEMFDQSGLSSGTFEELWWNIKTNRPERLKNVSAAVKQ